VGLRQFSSVGGLAGAIFTILLQFRLVRLFVSLEMYKLNSSPKAPLDSRIPARWYIIRNRRGVLRLRGGVEETEAGDRGGETMGKKLGGGGAGVQKGLLWRLPEVTSKELGKIGPGFGLGVGCGAGAGIGFFGGKDPLPSSPSPLV
jgi:hypothetical protein